MTFVLRKFWTWNHSGRVVQKFEGDLRNKRDSTHKGQAHSEIGPTSYGFVRIIAQMTKLASIRSSLISPVTLTSKCATINEHEESILCMTSPHVKRLSQCSSTGFVVSKPLTWTLTAFAVILFARKILKNSAESFRAEVTDDKVSSIGSVGILTWQSFWNSLKHKSRKPFITAEKITWTQNSKTSINNTLITRINLFFLWWPYNNFLTPFSRSKK